MEGEVTISKKQLFDLCFAYEKLSRLENGGVDNWEWYGESLNPEGYPSLDEFEESETERIAAL